MNPDWWFVKVLDEDKDQIEVFAAMRNKNGKQRGMKSKTKDLKDDWNISGMAGEWAASLAYNLPIGRILGSSKQELNRGDLSDWVEVKSSRYPDSSRWNLVVNEDQLYLDRVYINTLTYLWPEWVIVQGWAWGEKINSLGRRSVHGDTQHSIWILDQRELSAPSLLFDEMRKR